MADQHDEITPPTPAPGSTGSMGSPGSPDSPPAIPSPLGDEAAARGALGPAGQRIASIDTLRGFALLGILLMNIPFFALSFYAFMDPRIAGGFEGADLATWWFGHLFFEFKMMTLFSLLFGAGIVMMTQRADERGLPVAGVHYRRMGWLLLIGVLHGYLLWYGDILHAYAIFGMLVFPLRRLGPRWLLAMGLTLLTLGVLVNIGFGAFMSMTREFAAEAQAILDAGETPPPEKAWAIEAWGGMSEGMIPTEEALAEERAAHLGTWWELFKHRFPIALMMQIQMNVFFSPWRLGGLFLVGMALMKWGVFTAKRSNRFYLLCGLIGFGVGVPVVAFGAVDSIANEFDIVHTYLRGFNYNYIGSLFMAMGYIGLIMLLCKSGALTWLTGALAAVGRMALTNYLMQTLICTTIFEGYAFGLWGSLSRVELLVVVVGVWIVQLIYSPIWLRRFRFGPMEWLWRSLTYMRPQPMRLAPEARA
ncbi:MAG: DUF418 domain-containing protein [Phycisphaerales bacterium]|nr:MAG: DUF418 domain-containing protein [Phycisphaerales bacterium]